VIEPAAEPEELGLEEIAIPPVAEEFIAVEPAAELEVTTEEEPEEMIARRPAEEPLVAAELERPVTPEEQAIEVPAWATTEAIEVELEVGPDMVLLTEDEEGQVQLAQDRFVPLDLVEPAADADQVVEEVVVPTPEAPTEEPELVGPPTWVAVEEEPTAEPTIVEAQEVREEIPEPESDEAFLALARKLWAAGENEEARATYERLLRSPLLKEVTADLEGLISESPDEPMLRLLGDAYMKDDRLDDALGAYRRALSSL
jgi:tetratricopeptide (TPR) repeat protein